MTRLDLPQRTALDFKEHISTAKAGLSACHRAKSLLTNLIYCTCLDSSLGLYLYGENRLAKHELTIIVPPLTSTALNDMIQVWLESVRDGDDDDCLGCGRRAIFEFVHLLHVPALSVAFGEFDSFHWGEPATPCSTPEDTASSFLPLHDIAHALPQLSGMRSAHQRLRMLIC